MIMVERMMIFEPGDRFATLAKDGEVKIWQVERDGYPNQADPTESVGLHRREAPRRLKRKGR